MLNGKGLYFLNGQSFTVEFLVKIKRLHSWVELIIFSVSEGKTCSQKSFAPNNNGENGLCNCTNCPFFIFLGQEINVTQVRRH